MDNTDTIKYLKQKILEYCSGCENSKLDDSYCSNCVLGTNDHILRCVVWDDRINNGQHGKTDTHKGNNNA